MRKRNKNNKNEDGFAMIMVIMILALLSVLLAGAITATNTFRIQTKHAKQRLEQKAAAFNK